MSSSGTRTASRAAAPRRAALAGDVDEDATHHLRGHAEEVAAILPAHLIPAEQPQADLVHERRRLQRRRALARERTQRHAVQLVVDERHHLFEGALVAFAPGAEQALSARQTREDRAAPWGGDTPPSL